MRKILLPATVLGVALFALLYVWLVSDSHDLANYKRLHLGMTVDDVQAILGPGTPVKQETVPGMVWSSR